ncbi:hypothetical protein ACTNF7_003433 [Citrobacter braakii]
MRLNIQDVEQEVISILNDLENKLAIAQLQLKDVIKENKALTQFIKSSCYVYDGDGSDISDAYLCAYDSELMPKITVTDAVMEEQNSNKSR